MMLPVLISILLSSIPVTVLPRFEFKDNPMCE